MFKSNSLVLTATLVAGCMTSTVQNAHTLGKRSAEVGVEPGLFTGDIGGEGALSLPALPVLNVSVRYGLTDRLDLGGRMGTGLYDIHAKYMFTSPDAKGPVVSIVPSTTVFWTGDVGFVQVKAPVLLGLGSRRHQFVLGPYIGNSIAFGDALRSRSTGVHNIVTVGTSIGFATTVHDRVRIMPELAVGYPVSISSTAADVNLDTDLLDSPTTTFTLGFLIGAD